MAPEPQKLSGLRIALNECKYFENRFPQLKDIGVEAQLATAEAVRQVYIEHIKLIDPTAADLTRIDAYRQLIETPAEYGLSEGPSRALARILLKRGMAGFGIAALPEGDPLRSECEAAVREHQEHYGMAFDAKSIPGCSRGLGLIHYFVKHPHFLKGRKIAHIAPNKDFASWLEEVSESFACEQIKIDGFQPGMDVYEDLCAMTSEDDSFDMIICHRVLEHVIDGPSAYRELYRVLKPGGVLNVSVPEALYLETTSEWVVPDSKFHGHVRMYGRDFPDLLKAAGFRVERENWLVQRPFEELAAVKAIPMLMYNAFKD